MDILTLPPEYQLENWQWSLALLAAFIIGLSKAGLKGVAIVTVTLLAFIFGGKSSTGILLPMLTVGDIFAVIYYNRHANRKFLFKLMPWMFVGVLIGVYVGDSIPETTFKNGMAAIIFLTVIMMLWWDTRKNMPVPHQWWFAGSMGLSAGFTTMVGNLAGAFTNIYFLAMRLPKEEFIGTAAWLYFFVNLFKLPFHIFVWETVSWETLSLNFRLIPGILLGLFVGVKVVKIIKNHHYRRLILILTAIGALMIFFR